MYSDEKIMQSALYILNILGPTDRHKLFKILYFAEIKHLTKYGRPINGNDHFVKMEYGPVPSRLFDFIKQAGRSFTFGKNAKLIDESFAVKGISVSAKIESDINYLSKSDIECLDASISENKDLSFDQLTRKSHGPAYNNSARTISVIEMAKEAGTNEEMLKYIESNIENLNCQV